MKSFQQYREEENLASPTSNPQESPMHPVAPQTQQQTQQQTNQIPPITAQPQKKDLNQLVVLLAKKLGTKAQEYRNLLNDIKPENISKFYELIENLSTLKQTVGAKVITQANQKMSQ